MTSDSLEILIILLGQALQETNPKRRAVIADEIRHLPSPEWMIEEAA